MRRDIIKDVEIIEPPLEELTRKYSTFSGIKRTCVGGCGCLVFLIIIAILIFKFALGVGPKKISTVPTDFPQEIPIYDKDSINNITYISGTYKNRVIEIAAIFPKIILTPLLSALDSNGETNNNQSSWSEVWKSLSSPVSDKRDIVKIQWGVLNTESTFLYNYYLTELKKANYTINATTQNKYEQQFSFSNNKVTGSFYVKTQIDNSKTETANLIVNYYSKK